MQYLFTCDKPLWLWADVSRLRRASRVGCRRSGGGTGAEVAVRPLMLPSDTRLRDVPAVEGDPREAFLFLVKPTWRHTRAEGVRLPMRLSRLYQPRNSQFWLLIVLHVLSSAISFILRAYELLLSIAPVLARFAIANVVIGIRIALHLMSRTAPQPQGADNQF